LKRDRESMTVRMKAPALFVVLGLLIAAAPAFGAVVAKGEGIVVTTEDVAGMQNTTPSNVKPTKDALVKATVKTVLFAKEAVAEEVPCKEADDKEGFDKTVALSECYLRGTLMLKGLMPGSVDSYYRAHPEYFKGADGKLLPLNDYRKEKIELGILKAKAPIFSENEFRRLFEKYKVKICGPDGCK
jgi:hypothetical protein